MTSKPHSKQFSTWADLYRHAEQLAQQLEAERRRAAEATSKWEFWVDEAHRLEEQYEVAARENSEREDLLERERAGNAELQEQLEASEQEVSILRVQLEDNHRRLSEQLEAERQRSEIKLSAWKALEEQLETLKDLLKGFLWDAEQGDLPSKGLRDKAREVLNPAEEPGWISPVQKVVQLQEQLEALVQALEHHGYGSGLCHCDWCKNLPIPPDLNPASGSTERSGNWALVVPEDSDPASEPVRTVADLREKLRGGSNQESKP